MATGMTILTSVPTAFVFSGGASLGACQAGMLEALFERREQPDLLVGTSVGAINAAFVASRPPSVQTARELQRIWRGLRRGHVFPANPVTASLGLLGLRDHSVSAASLRRVLMRHLGVDRLEQADVPLHVVTTDFITGEEMLLTTGPALDAILASAAIPGVFPPIPWGSRVLVDGGIVNNTPISQAVALGADRIIVLPALGAAPLRRAPRGVLAAGVAAVSRALTYRLVEDLARYRHDAELVVLPAPEVDGIMPTDFGHAEELVSEGLRRGREVLGRDRKVVPLRQAA
ncbi:MAG: patatin-like phospholipase family protein [Solirubrobacteraceae bacterium]